MFYQIIKELHGPQQSIFAPLKSKDGASLRQPEDIKKRWCEHYSELLNRHPVVGESVLDLIKQHEPIMALDEVPFRGEIKAEILKNGGEKMMELLEQVIQSVWDSEVPQDWRDAILVSLYKKGSKSDCSNFRGISLLSIVGKLFTRIYIYITGPLALRVESSPMARETGVQFLSESFQRLKKWYLTPPCVTLSIIRYRSRVKWSNPEKRVVPFLPPCSSSN